MENLPQPIYKFAQVFSTSHNRDIEKIFSDNEFETINSRHLLKWDFIYRDIANTAKANKLTSPAMDMGALWTARGVIIEGILYIFMMKQRFEDVINKYEKHHYHTCIARSKNSHLNGEEEGKLSIELFNDLDDDELSKSQIEQAKKLLGDYYDFIDESVWLGMLRDRNDTTHIYNEEAARQLVNKVLDSYIHEFQVLEMKIKERYSDEVLSSIN